MSEFGRRGWRRFPHDPGLAEWVEGATPAALLCASDPVLRDLWLRHGGTWFAGVNVLPNDTEGRVENSGPLRGAAVAAARARYGVQPWDSGQVSVVYPGYPRRDPSESEANHRYRLRRDAAHVDGLLPVGPERRRMIREPHAFVLGIPVTDCSEGAAPLVVWEGSHTLMRQAFEHALADHDPESWPDVDLTQAYHAARRDAFEQCTRVEIVAKPGEAYLLHRLVLHGVAPWEPGAEAPDAGRVIVYFRPTLSGGARDWLRNPA